MPDYDYDLAIIGAGSAGLTAAKVARFFVQKRVALLDKERLGGDCLYYGCVPSKSLIKSARVAHDIAVAAQHGLPTAGERPLTPLGAVNARVQAAIAEIGELDSEAALRDLGVDVLLGGARFVDAHTLQSGARTISSRYTLICTGSRPVEPEIPGLRATGYITNEDLFSLDRSIGRLAVIGGGPIGVELAQALTRLGSKVTIVNHGPRLLQRDDAELVLLLQQTLDAEGVTVLHGTDVTTVRREGEDKVLTLSGANAGELRVDEILAAVGRTPNVEGLALEAAGVAYGPKGITVNDQLQTTADGVYAAGDVTGGPQFTHFAGYQASQAVRNIFLPVKFKFKAGVLPWVTFSDPEIAHAGLTEEEAQQTGKPYTVVRFPYSHVERAVTDHDTVGLMKFIIDGKRRFIGCHIAGANAGELINELTLAMNNNLTVDAVIGSIHAYPTYSFGIPVALYDFVLNEHPQAVAKVGRFLSKFT